MASSGKAENTAGKSSRELRPQNPARVDFQISPRRWIAALLVFCVGMAWLFVFLDFHVNYAYGTELRPVRQLFNITREDSLASWFGVTQTFLLGLTTWLIYAVSRRQQATRFVRVGWLILALFFTYMAVDDGAEVHERMGSAFRVLQEAEPARPSDPTPETGVLAVFPSYPWQVLFLPAFSALGLFALIFLTRELEGADLKLLVVGGLSCFVLAVGLDFFEGLDETHPWNAYTWIAQRYDMRVYTVTRFRELPYEALVHFSKSIEECVEMMGTTFLWTAFLLHLTRRASSLGISWKPAAPLGAPAD